MGIRRFKYMLILAFSMEITRLILIAAYVVVGTYVLYRLFFRKDPMRAEYERVYKEIINSDKYKVKGQYDR